MVIVVLLQHGCMGFLVDRFTTRSRARYLLQAIERAQDSELSANARQPDTVICQPSSPITISAGRSASSSTAD